MIYNQLSLSGHATPAPNAHALHLPDLTYAHPKGRRSVSIEKVSLGSVGCIHAGAAVRSALSKIKISAASLQDAVDLIEQRLRNGLIWGVAGFTKSGINYTAEATALNQLYSYLIETERTPSLSIDGGVSEGSLGLNAVVAAMHGVETLGCIPLQGLKSVSQRNFMIVWGDTYEDREVLVGTIPDVLVCVGGFDDTRRECEKALNNGSVVLLLALKNYGPNMLPETYTQFEAMQTALGDKRLHVCRSIGELKAKLDLVWARALRISYDERYGRFKKFRRLLLNL